jgi:putative ABC transport system permease protein
MFKNYFQVAVRFLLKNKLHSVVSLLGLAVGMAGALLIVEYVSFEKSFDKFHRNYADIYRITARDNEAAEPQNATTIQWAGFGLQQEFAEVKDYTLIAPMKVFVGDTWAGYEDKRIDGEKIFFADPGVFRVFTFPFIKGDSATALNSPLSVVITESTARKLFGDRDPMGSSILIDVHHNLGGSGDDNLFKVTGVVKDVPANSHFRFDVLVSYNTLRSDIRETDLTMFWDFAYCYLLLQPGTDLQILEKKIKPFQEKTFGEGIHAQQGYLNLQPLGDIHLYSSLRDEFQVNGNGRALNFLITIGICILLSAYVNYINLSTAKSAERRTEVGIRKVVGASKPQLAMQLITESLLLNAVAFILAVVIADLSIPLLESIFNMTWPPRPDWLSLRPIAAVVAVIFVGSILSAAYPVFVLTSFKPLNVFTSSTLSVGQRKWSLGKFLMVVQFAFCIVLTAGTYVMVQQLRYMRSFDLGMDMDGVLVVKDYGFQPYRTYMNFKARVSELSFVSAVGASSAPPGQEVTMFGVRHPVRDIHGSALGEIKMVAADGGFFDVLKVNLIAGRMLDRSDSASATRVVINEATARLLGHQDPRDALGAIISKFKDQYDLEVIGVIRNYNQLSLRQAYEPTMYTSNGFWDETLGWNRRYICVRLDVGNEGNYSSKVADIQQIWKEVVTDDPFQYFFLDNFFQQQHHTDQVTGALFIFFSAYSLFITCVGLFGLIAYSLLRRTREIGIRKILGATASGIILLMSKVYLKVFAIAVVISIPLALWVVDRWLVQYTFRIEPGIWVFILPVLLVFMIIAGTLAVKTWQAARANPVDALKEK